MTFKIGQSQDVIENVFDRENVDHGVQRYINYLAGHSCHPTGVAEQWMSSLDLEKPVKPAKLWKTSKAGKTGRSRNNELSLKLS